MLNTTNSIYRHLSDSRQQFRNRNDVEWFSNIKKNTKYYDFSLYVMGKMMKRDYRRSIQNADVLPEVNRCANLSTNPFL